MKPRMSIYPACCVLALLLALTVLTEVTGALAANSKSIAGNSHNYSYSPPESVRVAARKHAQTGSLSNFSIDASVPLTTPTPFFTLTPTGSPATSTPTATITPPSPSATPSSPTSTPVLNTPRPTNTPGVCVLRFQDVPISHPDYDAILCAACRYIMDYFPCGTTPQEPCKAPDNLPYFRPTGDFNLKAEFARALSTAAGFSEDPGPQIYQDVPPSNPFYSFINRMSNRGLMGGFPCGGAGEPCGVNNLPYFRPASTQIRGQFARVVSNTAGFKDPVSGQFFEDVPPSHPFYSFIQRLAARGIIEGFPCGTIPQEPCGPDNRPYYRPDSTVLSRAEAATTIINTFFPGCQGSVPPTSTPMPTDTAIPTDTPVPSSTNTAMPATVTSVPSTSTAVPPTACVVQFTDVPQANTFYANIRCLACQGILGGYSDGTFRPNNDITRGQIAKVVSNAAGFNEAAGEQIYEDVPPSNTFYTWINRLSRRGHMGGYPCGGMGEPCGEGDRPYFRPNANATRAQLAKIVASAKGIVGTPTGQRYADVPPDNIFYIWIEQLSDLGVMGGYACGSVPTEPCDDQNRPYFRPFNNVTRGQASKIVANTFFPSCQVR
ncbi:MAG TPA: S-layer homology domain-containing protein [Chloroflexia bacterium]|nr:S-layer homology domain-containing protein [Chloroflexia bacterium]